jgi:hypothetical protein
MAHEEERRPSRTGHGAQEEETHGATPPHGDPLGEPHPETGGPHTVRPPAPEPERDSATPPHGDPLR